MLHTKSTQGWAKKLFIREFLVIVRNIDYQKVLQW